MVTIRLYPDGDSAAKDRGLLERERISCYYTPDLLDRLFGIKFGHVGIQVERRDIARALRVLNGAGRVKAGREAAAVSVPG